MVKNKKMSNDDFSGAGIRLVIDGFAVDFSITPLIDMSSKKVKVMDFLRSADAVKWITDGLVKFVSPLIADLQIPSSPVENSIKTIHDPTATDADGPIDDNYSKINNLILKQRQDQFIENTVAQKTIKNGIGIKIDIMDFLRSPAGVALIGEELKMLVKPLIGNPQILSSDDQKQIGALRLTQSYVNENDPRAVEAFTEYTGTSTMLTCWVEKQLGLAKLGDAIYLYHCCGQVPLAEKYSPSIFSKANFPSIEYIRTVFDGECLTTMCEFAQKYGYKNNSTSDVRVFFVNT